MDDIASLTPDNTAGTPPPTSPPTPDWRDTEAQANLAAAQPSAAPTFQHDPALSTADAPLGKLKAAGFSDPEIAQWSIQKRQELTQAGFNDGEIDSYLSGAVQPPTQIPQAVKDRFEGGAAASKLEGGLAQTIPAGIDLLSSPDGRTKLWNGVQQWLKSTSIADSIIDPLTVPGDVASGKVDLNTPEGMDRAIGLGMFVAFGRQSKLPLNGQTSGLALAAGQTIGRIERDPMGSINIRPVGELPKANDFLAAAQDVTGGMADEATQQKLLKLYQERGIHPAEVAHDAKSDVTITQDIVSGNDRIEAYQAEPVESAAHEAAAREPVAPGGEDVTGGQPPEPPPPGLPATIEPPAPEPGSYEAAQQKILDKISIGEKDQRSWSWKKLYTQMVDDLHPIAAAVKKAAGGKELPVSEDAYKLGRLTRGTFGKAEHMLEYGTFDFASNKNIGPSLKEILAPVRDDLNGLRAYLAAKRTVEIEASGRVSGFDLEAAKQVVAQGDKLHAAIADTLATYQSHVLAYLKDSGVLSQKSFDAMQAANRDYAPFFRVMADGQGAGAGRSFGPGSPIKALKGSMRDIVDPLESIIKNTYAFVSIAERNAVGLKLIDTLKEADKNPAYARSLLQNPDYKEPPTLKQIANKREPVDGEIVQYLKDNGIKDPPADLVAMIRTNAVEPDGNTISAFRDGAKESYTTADTDLVAAFRQLDQHDANLLLKIIALPAKTLRAGAVLTPDFMAKNMIRDFQGAFINSKGLFSPVDTARGLKSAITKDETFQSWLKSGGANSAMVAIDRRYLQESIEKLTAETGLATRAWNVIKSPLDGLRMLSELSENATRVGEYRKGLGKEGLDASKATQQEAGYASREVTLDFSRRGASIQAYNMITAFANANIQGIDRIGRAFKDRPTNTTLKIAGGITLPSVLLWYANHDDERYQNLPRWQKDLFWIVLTDDHIYRIPKDFALGVVFGSGAERVMESWFGSKNVDPKDAFKGFGGSVASAMLPGAVPTIALPIIEQFANRSTFTNQTLVPDHLEKGLPEYQYTPYTTELGKALGQIVGAFPGIRSEKLEPTALGGVARSLSSPALIENYVRAWSGGLGMYALQAADMTLRKSGVLPDPPKPASTLSDIPIIRAFTVRYPSASAQPIQDFYDEFDKSKRYYTSYMDKAQEGDAAAMAQIEAAGGPRMFVQLDGIKTVLTEHSQLIRDIYKDPAMPPGQKRQLIDQLYYSMIQVGQQGSAALKQIDDALAPKGAPAQ